MEDAVLDATMRLIGRNGISGLRTKDVATEAGVSKTEVKQRYPSRHDLIEAALQRFADDEVRRCEEALSALDDPDIATEDIVDGLIRELERTYSEPGGFFAQFEVYVAAARDPAIAAVAARCIQTYERMTERALLGAGLPPENALSCSRWIVALVDGFGLHGAAMSQRKYLPDDLALAIRALGAGALAPTASPRKSS